MNFTGERIVPGATNCEPTFAQKMYQEHVARYAFAAQFVDGLEVLDVGCGVGYGSQWLAKSGAKSVLGIDVAEDAIEHAKKNFFHPSVSFESEDATSMEFDGEFDVVACFEFIEHVDQQEKILDAIKRALRPDGTLIISTPRPLDEKRTDFHVHELDFEELRRLLDERFANVQCFFERNCFTSFVGAAVPKAFDNIVEITDRIKLDNADYFIFVAQMADKHEREIKPVLAINDDSYVVRLEQDAINFRNGENYHNQMIVELSQKNEDFLREIEQLKLDLEIQHSQTESIALTHEGISKLTGEIAAVREEISVYSERAHAADVELEILRRKVEELLRSEEDLRRSRDDLSCARDELVQRNDGLITENLRIRTVLSKVAQQLAETETRLNAKSAQAEFAEGLTNELATVREIHAQELSALMLKYEESERTLTRFRRSVSWNVTRPIRWIGRQYRKIVGRSVA